MSMTIGRATISADPYVGTLRTAGNLVSFTSDLGVTTLADCKAKAQQLRGLVENLDEDTFPFTWTLDATYDGFYRVRDVQVEPEATFVTDGRCRFSISMERIGGGYARPQFESIVQSIVRTNSHGVTSPSGFDLSWYAGTGTEADVSYTPFWSLTMAEGAHKWKTVIAPAGPTSYYVSTKPADYYLNTARIEVQYGSTWYPVHGQQVPLDTGVNWRISNGIIRLYPTSVGGNGRFTVESWRFADNWVGKEYGIITAASTFVNATGTSGDPSSFKIVKNAPEIVVVRVRQQSEAGAMFDFALRKGDFHSEVNIYQPDGATTATWGVQLSSAVASTSSTGSIRSTAATSSRYQQISCPSTVTADTANGGLRLSSAAATAVFAVFPDADMGIAYTATNARDLFLAARSERVRVVTR